MSNSFNWLTAALLCLVLGASHLLDGPSDIEAAMDTEHSAADAQTAAQQQARFERAAARICAEHGGAALVKDGQIKCIGRQGHQTYVAKVTL